MDIRTEGVQAVLGGSAILKGVDIQVGQRELVGIIGPNAERVLCSNASTGC